MKAWIATAVCAALYQLCLAKIEVKVAFKKFDNSKPTLLADGSCCDPSLLSHMRCNLLCDPSIVVCVTTVVGQCTWYKGRTGVYEDSAHVDLINNMGKVKNPLSITMDNWKQTDLIFQLDVNDYREGERDKLMDQVVFRYKKPRLAPHGQGRFVKQFLQGSHVLLSLDIAVQCAQHYYGPSCMVYCNPDRLLGSHFTCNKEGKQVCRKGFGGARCERSMGTCESAPCLNNGTCLVRSGGHFKCECGRFFMGLRCETPLSLKPNATPKQELVLTTDASTATRTADVTQYSVIPLTSSSTQAYEQSTGGTTFHVGDFHTCNETLEILINVGADTLEIISAFISHYRKPSQYTTVVEEKSNVMRLTVKPTDEISVDTASIVEQMLEAIGNKAITFNVTCSPPYVTAAQEETRSSTGLIVGATVGVLLLVGALSAGFVITKQWGSKRAPAEDISSRSVEDREKRVLEMLTESKDNITSPPPICSTD